MTDAKEADRGSTICGSGSIPAVARPTRYAAVSFSLARGEGPSG